MNKYPRSLLEETAAASSSLVDLMRRVGAPMGSKPLRYLRNRLAHYGIDTSHFRDEPLPERPKRSYSKEILSEAAACSTSIREMFLHMGIPPEDGPYEHVKRRMKRFGIDTRHFKPPRGVHNTGLFPEEEFTRAVAASHGLADLMRRLGLPEFNGAARAKARRSIDDYGLSTEHFTGQGHCAGIPSPTRKSAEEILVRLPTGSSRAHGPAPAGTRRDRRPPDLRGLRGRRGLAGQAPGPGDRPRQRRLHRQPPRQPAAPLPELPCADQDLESSAEANSRRGRHRRTLTRRSAPERRDVRFVAVVMEW
ncbi:HNH endonuclease [Streptomyces sp. BH055]|uniref:HNH endonuclease n=1 Tax=Streptomyces sp. BH055 TaxID=3401173 RepID=UPI003BB78177